MRGPVARFGVQRGVERLGHPVICIRPGASPPQFIVQPRDSAPEIALAPVGDRGRVQVQAPGNGGVRLPRGTGQNDLGAPHQPMRQRARVGEADKLGFLFARQNDGLNWATTRHEHPPG